jgi:hypothetical protein
VSILIREYPQNRYNTVIFNQSCKFYNKLGEQTLNKNSYIERIAYRLKKWAGIPMEQQPYIGKEGPLHMRNPCEVIS